LTGSRAKKRHVHAPTFKERKKENNTALGADRTNPLRDSMELQQKTRLSLLHILHVYTRQQEGVGGVCGGGDGYVLSFTPSRL